MRLGVMQPYLFPYLGYYQLVNAVDKFVFYDDVAFIKQGWINRNQILNNGEPYLFSVPVKDVSSFKRICDTEIDLQKYESWRRKFLKCLTQNYAKAPHFQSVFPLVENVLNCNTSSISEMAIHSIKAVFDQLGIRVKWVKSSFAYSNGALRSTERLFDICRKEGASIYINTAGGSDLYSKDEFAVQGIRLQFLKTDKVEYRQFREFIPSLSMIDVLMFNSNAEACRLLECYHLE